MEGCTILIRIVAISKALRNLDSDLVTLPSSLGQLAPHALLQILLRRHGSWLWRQHVEFQACSVLTRWRGARDPAREEGRVR
jgi:hypothetical protein